MSLVDIFDPSRLEYGIWCTVLDCEPHHLRLSEEPQEEKQSMKLVRHHEDVVALFERAWEKAYVLARQATHEWIPLVLPGQVNPCAEIHPITRLVRLCEGYALLMEQRVTFQDLDDSEGPS